MEDVVYLKNGTIYRGLIIEQNLNQNIKIQTYDWNIIAINFDEIEKILKEIVPPGFDAMEIPLIKFNKRGFINITEMGYGFANTSHDAREGLANQDLRCIRMVNGYQITQAFSLGIGLEINEFRSLTLTPLTLDARITMAKTKIRPVFIINGGYSFGWNGILGGYVINPQLGFKAYISKKVAFVVNFGYRIQAKWVYIDAPVNHEMYLDPEKLKYYYQYSTISAGFSF